MTRTTNFGFDTTASEVVSSFADRVRGRVFLVTGPSEGGLGAEVALALARSPDPPAALLLVGRGSAERYASLVSAIKSEHPDASLDVRVYAGVDLSDLSSVRAGARAITTDWTDRGIDVLVNNAGVFGLHERVLSVDGIEQHFAANYVGHFLLTNLLVPLLLKTSEPRVVNVTSLLHMWASGNFTDYNFDKTTYSWRVGYAQSKLANIYFSRHLASVLGSRGLTAFSPHPGAAYATNVFREFPPEEFSAIRAEGVAALGIRAKTTSQGAATIVLAALDPALAQHNGAYLVDCKEADVQGAGAQNEVGPGALWRLSESLVNERFLY